MVGLPELVVPELPVLVVPGKQGGKRCSGWRRLTSGQGRTPGGPRPRIGQWEGLVNGDYDWPQSQLSPRQPVALGGRAVYDERETGEQMPTLPAAPPLLTGKSSAAPASLPGREQEPPPACAYLRRRGSPSSWKRGEAA